MNEASKVWQNSQLRASGWTSKDLISDQRWIYQLTTRELFYLWGVTLRLSSLDNYSLQVPLADIVVEPLVQVFEKARCQLQNGPGLFLFRGLNIKDYQREHFTALGVGLAAHLGAHLIPQNASGDVVSYVTANSKAQLDQARARGHRGHASMSHHSDSSETAVLLCVRAAKSGGATSVCSSRSVYYALLKEFPADLSLLEKGFFFDMSGKTNAGVTSERVPIFTCHNDIVDCHFNESRIIVGMEKAGVPPSRAELSAIRRMSYLASHPDFALRFTLKPGDILMLNNSSVLHARDVYEDWPQPNRKRLLLRYWMNRKLEMRRFTPND